MSPTDAVADVRAAVIAGVPDPATSVVVALSGGLDSAVLLHAAATGLGTDRVCAVHVNHGLQPAAADFETSCRALCRALGVRLDVDELALLPGPGQEARAREARYAALAERLPVGGRLLVAHHRRDQAETVLLRLAQGRAFGSMPAQRPFAHGTLVRPLLRIGRPVLERYAAAVGLEPVDDPTNTDTRFDRNFIRHEVLAPITDRWPQADAAIAGAAQRTRDLADATALMLRDLWGAGPVPVDRLARYSDAGLAALLRAWLVGLGGVTPTAASVDEFVRQITHAQAATLTVGDGRLHLYRRALFYEATAPGTVAPGTRSDESARVDYLLDVPGQLHLPWGRLSIEAATEGFTCGPSNASVTIRFRRGGERIHDGRRRVGVALKKLLQESGIPPWQRARYPLIYVGERLVCVPGLAVDDRVGNGVENESRFRARWQPAAAVRHTLSHR